jgi:hypothetical protein
LTSWLRVRQVLRILRVLRALRALRALRFIARQQSLRIVTATMLSSARPVSVTSAILCSFFLVLALTGVQLFAGAFWRCTDLTRTSPETCTGTALDGARRLWYNRQVRPAPPTARPPRPAHSPSSPASLYLCIVHTRRRWYRRRVRPAQCPPSSRPRHSGERYKA